MARTFKQQGQGFGANPVSIVAVVNGVEVFNGPINTVDQDPSDTYTGPMVDLFTWELPVDFVGSVPMQITVTGGSALVLGQTLANYMDPLTEAGALAVFNNPYYEVIDGEPTSDPLSNITINGVAQTPGHDLPGQWFWDIPTDSVFACTVNVNANGGNVVPEWSPTESYGNQVPVQSGGKIYTSVQAVPAGTPVTNTDYWMGNLDV
jgi:hypothetical protein